MDKHPARRWIVRLDTQKLGMVVPIGSSMMKRIAIILLGLAVIFSPNLETFAEKEAAEDIFIILPAQSIERFLIKLLPYDINLGEHFSGYLQVRSIKNLKIEKAKISFSSHLSANNIKYTHKIGEKLSTIDLGKVDLSNDWEGAFRFDKSRKTLYIRPHLKEQVAAKKENQRGTILNVLFKALSDIDYPIDLNNINPITAEFFGNILTIGFDVSNVYAANNQLTVMLRPIPRKTDMIKTPAKKTS